MTPGHNLGPNLEHNREHKRDHKCSAKVARAPTTARIYPLEHANTEDEET